MYGLNSDLLEQYQVRIWPQLSNIIGKSSAPTPLSSNPAQSMSYSSCPQSCSYSFSSCWAAFCAVPGPSDVLCVCGPGFELCLWEVDNHCSAWPSRPLVKPDKEMPGWFICSHTEAFSSCILLQFWNSTRWSSIFCDFLFLAVLHSNIHIILLHLWLESFLFLPNLPDYACFGMGFAIIFIPS